MQLQLSENLILKDRGVVMADKKGKERKDCYYFKFDLRVSEGIIDPEGIIKLDESERGPVLEDIGRAIVNILMYYKSGFNEEPTDTNINDRQAKRFYNDLLLSVNSGVDKYVAQIKGGHEGSNRRWKNRS